MRRVIPALFILFLSLQAGAQSQAFIPNSQENPNGKILTNRQIIPMNSSQDSWKILPFFFIDREAAFLVFTVRKWELRISAESIYDLDWWKEKFRKSKNPVHVPLSELEYEMEAPVNMKAGITICF